MKKQLWTSLVLLIVVAAIFVACATAAQPTQSPTTWVQAANSTEPPAEASNTTTLLFLGNKNIAPVVYLDGTTPSGIAVDIVHALAKHMPQPVEIRAMNWSEAQALVARGDADALIQINPTEERKKIYDFSDPLLESHFSIFTRADRLGISGLSSLRGLRVGVESGGLPQNLLKSDPQVQLTIISNFTEGFRQLDEGSLDAVVVDYRVGSYVLATNKIWNIKVTGDPIASSNSSFAVKKGNTQLLNEINQALQIIKADGTYQKIIENWQPTETVFETQEQISERNYLTIILILLLLFLVAGIWMVTVKKELTRRKAAEEKLSEQYSTLRGIIDSTHSLIFSVDRHYRYTSFNRGHAATMKAIYGAEIEPGHSILEYMTAEEDRETARHNLDRALAGEHVVEEAYSGEELRSRHYFQVSHSPIRAEEEIIGVAVIAQDITEHKKVENALRKSEEQFRNVFDWANDAILLHTLTTDGEPGRFIGVNLVACRMLGYTRDELLAMGPPEIVPPELHPQLTDIIRQVQTSDTFLFEIKLLRKDGTTVPVESSGHLVNYEGKRIWISHIRDITDRKRAEEQRENLVRDLAQKNTELDRFTYTVSHDLKSPLLSIQGFLALLEEDIKTGNTEQVAHDIQRISGSAEKLEHLITTLLDLSRSGKTVDTPLPVSFRELVREAADLLDATLQKRGVKLVIPDILPVVSGDRQRLLQVMTTLLDNAVKFMGDQKEPRIEIGVRDDTGAPVFFVQDNGMGIKKENLSQVFMLFKRFNPDIPGTGIGLATVKRIIEAHGGKVWIESEGEGKGTTLCFTLPVAGIVRTDKDNSR